MFGSKINYRLLDFADLTAIYGAQRVGFKTSDAKIFGFNSEFQLDSVFEWNDTALYIGFSYVGREQDIDFETPNFEALTNAYSVRFRDYSHGNIYSSAEYVIKSNDAVVQSTKYLTNSLSPEVDFCLMLVIQKRVWIRCNFQTFGKHELFIGQKKFWKCFLRKCYQLYTRTYKTT